MKLKDIKFETTPFPVFLDKSYILPTILSELYEKTNVGYELSEEGLAFDEWLYQQYSEWEIPLLIQNYDYLYNPPIADGSNFSQLLDNHLAVHKTEYDGLVELAGLEYNPIENYNGIEHEFTTRTPDLVYHNIGSNTTAPRNDQTKNDYAQQTTTNTINKDGEKKTTVKDEMGLRKEITKEKDNIRAFGYQAQVGDDAKDYAPKTLITGDKTDEDYIDNHTTIENTHTDQSVVSPHLDTTTFISGEYTDKNDDTTTETGNEKTDRWFQRAGNMGVTTTQQMIEEERGILHFSIFKFMIEEFLKEYGFLKIDINDNLPHC